MPTQQERLRPSLLRRPARLRFGIAFLGAVLVTGGPIAASPQPAPPPDAAPPGEPKVLEADPKVTPGPVVTAGCSETDLRQVVATLSWPGEPGRAATQRIDVTIFKDGFATGLFASIAANGEGRFAPAAGASRMERGPGRPFDLVAVPKKDNRKNMAALEVRRLEPGLLYRFRLLTRTDKGWVPGQVVTVQAPVCVSDEAKER